jgi:hypothetical protein
VSYSASAPGSYNVHVEWDGVSLQTFPRTVAFSAKGNVLSGSVMHMDQLNVQLQKGIEFFFF